jgi:hypothetical protein
MQWRSGEEPIVGSCHYAIAVGGERARPQTWLLRRKLLFGAIAASEHGALTL